MKCSLKFKEVQCTYDILSKVRSIWSSNLRNIINFVLHKKNVVALDFLNNLDH